jgi:hypothetical protein
MKRLGKHRSRQIHHLILMQEIQTFQEPKGSLVRKSK